MIDIAGYKIDAAISEEHTLESEITEFPVEDGADTTDNVRNLPRSVTINFVVSDTPIGLMLTERTGAFALEEAGLVDAILPSAEAFAFFETIHENREPVSVTTSRRVYDDMILESLTVPVDATTGDALTGTAVFRRLEIRKNTRVRVAHPRMSKKQAGGHRSSKRIGIVTTQHSLDGTDRRVIFVPTKTNRMIGEPWYATENGTPIRPMTDVEKRVWAADLNEQTKKIIYNPAPSQPPTFGPDLRNPDGSDITSTPTTQREWYRTVVGHNL